MIAFPSMLASAAIKAGMKVPPEDRLEGDLDGIKEEFPHWFVYCMLQLCRPIAWGDHWENAKIIAAIPEDQLKTMTEDDFRKLVFDP